ncbi:hypothetical protein AYI68_g1277 [Smittium mucronatum]|uniref:Uncharacterized protein n=1 Tax=Smittium mucronatum TaxID=133383 RepID=A0A1R0H639_9FUNG|nr:hypothetical protein AYI68_g1277 [Smittium mucronatum]
MTIAVFKLLKAMLDSGTIPKIMETSMVFTEPKKDNPKDPKKDRKLIELETWMPFVDFAKAYELVPHIGLIYKLKSGGIRRKLLDVINGL